MLVVCRLPSGGGGFTWHVIVEVSLCSCSAYVPVHWSLGRCSNLVLFNFLFDLECSGYMVPCTLLNGFDLIVMAYSM